MFFLFIERIFSITIPKWLIFILDLIVFFVFIKILYFIIKKIFFSLAKKTKTNLDDHIFTILEMPLLVSLAVVYIIGTSKFLLSTKWYYKVLLIGKTIILAMISWFLYSLVGVFYKTILLKHAKKTKSKFDDQLYPLLRKVLRVVIFIFAFIYLLSIWKIDITPVLAGVGIGGLAIAFAAQKMLADIFGGLVIFSDKPFQVYDRVNINGVTGIVEEVGLRSTKIRTYDNNIVTIPNSKIVDANIENYNMPDKEAVIRMNLGLVYDTPVSKIKEAKKILEKILKKHKEVNADSVSIYFNEFKDSSLNIFVYAKIKDIAKRFKTLDELNIKIKEEFEKANIEFAYPTQTIYLKK